MIKELDVFINEPFDAGLIKPLYAKLEDLKLSHPRAKFPFNEVEWTDEFTSDPDNTSLVFMHQGKLIGHIAIIPSGRNLYLCYVILTKEYRGQGWSDKMLLETEEFCRLNYSNVQVFLNVDKKNVKAQNLYTRMGYSLCGEEGNKFKMKKYL